jgi:HlyD family secretion protein
VKPRLRTVLVFGGIVAVVLGLKFVVFRPGAAPITVFRVAQGRVEETVTNSKAGTVKSRRRATISPEIGGRVETLEVRKGARVRRGDVLMRIASADTRAQLSLQERSLDVALASERESCQTAVQLERDLGRSKQLHSDKILSLGLLEQSETQWRVAVATCEASHARVSQAKAAVELARINLDKTVLRAPFDGVVADLSTEVGEWITPSPPGLPIPSVIEVFDPLAVYVSAPLDEVDVAKLHEGALVRITMDSYPGKTLAGKVTRVAPYVVDVKEQNRTFEIEVEFADSDFALKLLPGTSADVVVILSSRESVLRVPSYAVLEGGRVLVVKEGRLVSGTVKTGLKNWEFAEVLEGLRAGDAVAVSLDRAEVKEGARVRIEAETLK